MIGERRGKVIMDWYETEWSGIGIGKKIIRNGRDHLGLTCRARHGKCKKGRQYIRGEGKEGSDWNGVEWN